MYKWKIEIILKSGNQITGYYKGNEYNNNDVAKILFEGANNSFNAISGEREDSMLMYRLGDVSAMTISIVM